MRNLEDVVTPMPDNQLAYIVKCPPNADINRFIMAPTALPFSTTVIDFVTTLSKTILSNPLYASHPEMVAMAFWMRKTSILKLKQKFQLKEQNNIRLARGTTFHIAPANVDIMFMYSWLLSMLVGNKNVVRLPSEETIQTELLIELINTTLQHNEFEVLRNKIFLVRYQHNAEVTQFFSNICTTRIIWGGDSTIQAIRKIPIPPSANELTFANKVSCMAISAAELLLEKELVTLATDFYNDTYWYMQQACSSPRFIFWIGKEADIMHAKERFWHAFNLVLEQKKPSILPGEMMNKIEFIQNTAIHYPITIEPSLNNCCIRIAFRASDYDLIRENHCGSGLFCETNLSNLADLSTFLNRTIQTLTVFGISNPHIKEFITQSNPKGIDRIVPIGKALEFSATWDGYDLLNELSREVSIDL